MEVKFNIVSKSLFGHFVSLFPSWIGLTNLSPFIIQYIFINPDIYMTYDIALGEFEINGLRKDISYFAMLFEQAHYRFLRDEYDAKCPPPKYLKGTSFRTSIKSKNTQVTQNRDFASSTHNGASATNDLGIKTYNEQINRKKRFPPCRYVFKIRTDKKRNQHPLTPTNPPKMEN